MGIPSRRRVEAFYSVKAKEPKLHLEVSCEGLSRIRVDPAGDDTGLGITEFPSMRSLGQCQWARPCRMCALERVIDGVLRPTGRDKTVFATFSSQPSYGADSERFLENNVSETGRARLVRIAERLELATVEAKVGPVAYGFLPATGVKVLARNLRTQSTTTVAEMPATGFMVTFWTFLDDAPPELMTVVDGVPTADPWKIAQLITTA